MKLGVKIIFSITIFFSVIFLAGGYALISYFYEITMAREAEAAIGQYQYNKFVVQAYLITKGKEWFAEAAEGRYDFGSMVSDMDGEVALFTLDHTVLFSDFPAKADISGLLEDVDKDIIYYRFLRINNRMYLIMTGVVAHGDTGIYLVTGTDVERVLEQQEQILKKFGAVYAMAVGIGAFLIFGISVLITKPIKQLTVATKKIADGDYGERVPEGGGDEVGQLAQNFNRMAVAVEEKVQELSENARQKEDFVANFAHELKTPLTSVIGYADRIYKKELPREEQKKAAWYIWNEGMRLEALSLKLMDLIILNHKDFCLQEMESEAVFRELAADVAYLMEEKGVTLDCAVESAFIHVEYDLFKTLFLNLVDNAVKAGAKRIQVTGSVKKTEESDFMEKKEITEENSQEGKHFEERKRSKDGIGFRKEKPDTEKSCFVVQIQDNGSGIPRQEIKRITEAFYMVDKSRSRKQHGAGIGLALAEKIARIHGGSLDFESDGESGTTVKLCLKCRRAVEHEEG